LEVALNVGLDISFDKMEEWKAEQDNAGEAVSTKIYIINDQDSR
jgi:hypothetical protein